MISFRDIGYLGRLGNQLFQFASTIGIADMRGYIPAFPIENTTSYKGTGPIDPKTGKRLETRCELLDCFDIREGIFFNESQISTTHRFNEIDFNYNPGVENLPENVDLFGYFQNERYFSHIRKDLLKILKFRSNHIEIGDNFLSVLNTNTLISLHIRRGDYLNLPEFHPVCTIEYYEEAISILNDTNTTFLIFSDDLSWAKDKIMIPNSVFVELGNPYVEMYLMTQCKHHIIANSSFSWWGAWLAEDPDQEVIAPSRWFGESMNKDTSGIYCKTWKVI